MQLNDCLFCKIQRKEISSDIIYSDEICFAIMDKFPSTYGHVLVIPNEHYPNYMETDPVVLKHLIKIAQRVAIAQERAFGNEGNKLVINCKEVGNQKIFHTHVHVLPYYENTINIEREPLEKQAAKMREALLVSHYSSSSK